MALGRWENGAKRTYTIRWDVTTERSVPAQLMRLYSQAIALRE
jgi:hypothetical protein